MTDVVIDRIRLRGAGTARLARIAARSLPRALDRALGDLGDADIPALAVSLDPGVLLLDDDSVAAVWADAIRAALIADGVPAGRRPAKPERRHPAAASVDDPPAGPAEGTVRRWAGAWARSRAPRGPVAAGAIVLAARAPLPASRAEERDAALDVALGGRIRAALIEELRLRRNVVGAAAGDRRGAASAPPSAGPDEPASTQVTARMDAAPARTAGPAVEPSPAGRSTDDLERLATALADLVADRRPDAPVDLDRLTRAAGLCLLYPWLADHCRAAEEALPREEPAAARVVALAALVDPDDPGLLDDVLVRHLAGLRRGDPAVPPARFDIAEVRDSAVRVIRSFVALLPGFEKSSASFVRREWLDRPGLLDDDRDPLVLTAHARPLDVLLGALPYPLGLFALPWCRPVTVRFRP